MRTGVTGWSECLREEFYTAVLERRLETHQLMLHTRVDDIFKHYVLLTKFEPVQVAFETFF